MTDIAMFIDRFNLSVQEKRERARKGNDGKRTLVPLKWQDVIQKLNAIVGTDVEISSHRHFAVIKLWRDDKAKVPHMVMLCGIFDPRKRPKGWKAGDAQVSDIHLPKNMNWIHTCYVVFPLVGQEVIVQNTRSGPHIGDVSAFLKELIQVNFVDHAWVPPLKFWDAVRKQKRFRWCSFKLQRRDRGLPTKELPEAEMARNLDAEFFELRMRPRPSRYVDKSPVLRLLKKLLPGQDGEPAEKGDGDGRPYDYGLVDATLHPEKDGQTITDVIQLNKDARRQVIVAANESGDPQPLGVIQAMADDLTQWLA